MSPTPHSDSELDTLFRKFITDYWNASAADSATRLQSEERNFKSALINWADRRAEKLVAEAMEKFGIKKGVKYDVKASGTVIVLTATKEEDKMSNLVDYAKEELTRAGLFDEDSDYNGMLGKSALEIIEVFAKQGHSGFSASTVTQIVERLMQYKPLTPLTYEPDEWQDVSEFSGEPMWQNKRNSAVFSKDGGKTYYDIDVERIEAIYGTPDSEYEDNTEKTQL